MKAKFNSVRMTFYSQYEGGEEQQVSLPRAQMLFWTGLLLVLFVVKSLADGALWEVPWEMVALMGMSQGTYVGQKAWQYKKKYGDRKE